MHREVDFPPIRNLNIDRYAKILSTGIGLPEDIVTNQDIIDQYGINATDRAVQYSLGIKERRWTNPGEKLEDLMAKAVVQCLGRANINIDLVDRVIVTKLFGDFQIPASAVSILKKLGATIGIPAFDIASACSGFIHAMDLAMRFIATGDDYVLIISGSAAAKCEHVWRNLDSRTVFLFGDAVTATLLSCSDIRHILSSYIFTNHHLYDVAKIPCGTGLLDEENRSFDPDIFHMKITDGSMVLNSTVQSARLIADTLLSAAGLTIDDLDFFVTSDQSSKIWEAQLKELGIPPAKSLSLFHQYGNTVAAMSPLNLDGLIVTDRLKRGDLVMMQAHGAGASSGGILFRY